MASDDIKSGGNATFVVKVGGNPVPSQYNILSVYIEKRINKISNAKITILDGDSTTETFAASSSALFVPGAKVVVEAGYDSSNQVIFQGIITSQSLRVDELVGSALELECKDESIKMVVGRKCLSFSNQKDSDIISSIIGTYSGLTANVSATTTQWPEQIQYYATDWDFMLARAEANGLVVTTINGTVAVQAPDANSTPVLIAKYGDNILQFNAVMDSITQLGDVKASSWDFTNQAVTTGESTNSTPGPGNISSKTLSEVVGLSSYQLQSSAALQSADLTNWSKAQLVKSEYSKIRGEIKFQGTSLVDPGKYITVQGMGDRFDGDHLISGALHSLADGNWFTEVSVGLSFAWFTEEPDVVAPPASGLLPGVRGLLNATVKKIDSDPDSQYRILVVIPMIDPNGEGIWARLTNFYSTNGAGAFFLPEVGDEVIVGFLNEDPRYPMILGSVYSSTKLKPYQTLTPNEKNSLKAIVSKTGIMLQFDDENKVLTIVTPDKNTLILSDKDKQITLQDDNSNSIVMSSSGITIKSPKNITLEADQNVIVKGTQGVQVAASGGDVQISGINIKETADSQYSAQGGETSQINGGMELTLKSAMIMIN